MRFKKWPTIMQKQNIHIIQISQQEDILFMKLNTTYNNLFCLDSVVCSLENYIDVVTCIYNIHTSELILELCVGKEFHGLNCIYTCIHDSILHIWLIHVI